MGGKEVTCSAPVCEFGNLAKCLAEILPIF